MIRILLLVFAAMLAAACSQTAPGGPPPASTGTAAPAPQPGGFEKDWADLVKAAQREGTVFVAGETLGASKEAMKQALRQKYGINVEIMDGRGAEVIAKIKAERQAGLFVPDIGLMGISTVILDVKPMGITVPLQPLLVLPEVLDGKKWRGGQIPFVDQDRHSMAQGALAVPLMITNTDLVRSDEIKSHMDLLQPRWKGKIAMTDPSTSGTASNWFTHMVTRVYGREKGLQFMRDLAKQDIQLTRDIRLFTEWVARGKYPVGIGQSMTLLTTFKEAGAPIGFPKLEEPPFLSGGSSNLFVFDRAPHPNAARLFANWLASQEGGRVFVPALGYPSLRLDIPSDYVDPVLVPSPDIPYKAEDDYVRSRAEMRRIAGEIFK